MVTCDYFSVKDLGGTAVVLVWARSVSSAVRDPLLNAHVDVSAYTSFEAGTTQPHTVARDLFARVMLFIGRDI